MASRQDRLAPNGVPRYLHLYDNGGKTADRYTIVFTGRYRQNTGGVFWYVSSSSHPTHPQGVYQHGESHMQVDWPTYGHLGRKIKWSALPESVRRCVWKDYAELWGLTLPLDLAPCARAS